MRYGIILTAGDIHQMVDMAREAEDAGWDGVFYWDAIAIPGMAPIYDPWVTLAAFAMRTERVRLGNIISPPSRRRPWKLARETATLDHLSGGRLVLPVGLGALDDVGFGGVGEATDARTRAELLDESLEILTRAWSGEPFRHNGKHYQTAEMTLRPPSLQQPRIPIWVVGVWPRPKSVDRALRYDGIVPQVAVEGGGPGRVTPDEVRAIADVARERRGEGSPFDIVIGDVSPGDDAEAARAIVQPLAEAGATWWIESPWMESTVASLRARIAAGPPR
ncbi:MAG: Coenzyme F420-dependent N5N10-methylene tetrahydromethanopterin reductase and related [Thermomicrobiales bacterium]|nr:Coenzyme F420-dependent N5N10-methylene tetrahydromethanopterin reductase and related [Thermomicrobiales bacterium]